jgi:hypothetical protein
VAVRGPDQHFRAASGLAGSASVAPSIAITATSGATGQAQRRPRSTGHVGVGPCSGVQSAQDQLEDGLDEEL